MNTVFVWVLAILSPGSNFPSVAFEHSYAFTTLEQCQTYARNKQQAAQGTYFQDEQFVCVATQILPAGVLQ